VLLVGRFRKLGSKRFQVLGVLSKELPGDTWIAKQQQSFIEREREREREYRKVHFPRKRGAGSESVV
jgi:hypothetical protein